MADEKQVKKLIQQIIDASDLASLTPRNVIDQVTDKLDLDKAEWKKFIKTEISAYLHKKSKADDDEIAQDEEPTPKKPRVSVGQLKPGLDPGTWQVNLLPDGTCRVLVNLWKGTVRVDLRKLYQAQDGSLAPSKQGINLTDQQWAVAFAVKNKVSKALAASDEDFDFGITEDKRIRITTFKGRSSVDLREHYLDDSGALAPGKKGIAVTEDIWETLIAALPQIDVAIIKLGGKPKPVAAVRSVPPKTSAAGGGPAAVQNEAPVPEGMHPLGRNRFAGISLFKGKQFVGIREYYVTNGEYRPGKKGISLSSEQFNALNSEKKSIRQAIADRNTSFKVPLSSKRKVLVSEFKGSLLIDIREFYEKMGQEHPGGKGIALSEGEFQALLQIMDSLCGQLQN